MPVVCVLPWVMDSILYELSVAQAHAKVYQVNGNLIWNCHQLV